MTGITHLEVMYYSPHLAKELMIFTQKSTLHQATGIIVPPNGCVINLALQPLSHILDLQV